MDILHDTRFPLFSKSEQSFYISSPFFNVGNLDKKKEIQDAEMLAKLLKHSVNIQLALYVCYILGFEETFKTIYYNMYEESDEEDERQPEAVQIFIRALNGTMDIESESDISSSEERLKVKSLASLRSQNWGCSCTPCSPCSTGLTEEADISLDVEQIEDQKELLLLEKYSNLSFNPLLLAAECGHVELVKYFHQQQFNFKGGKTTTGYSCLHLASMNDHIETVGWLLENTSAHDCMNIKGQTALHLAAKYNNIEVCKSILDKGRLSNLHPKDNQGNTPLHIASENGSVEIVKALILKCSSSITEFIKKNACSETPLHLACKKGHVQASRQLLQWKFGDEQVFKVESIDEENRTPLHLASEEGHLQIVELLIKEHGANIKHTDKYGASSLHRACEKGHLDVVKKFLLLVDISELVDLKSNDDQTALHKAASNDQHEIVEELLSVQDLSKNPTDKYGNTPLHLACRGGFEKTVERFLDPKHECNVESLNNDGENVLHLAAQGGNVKVVETLVTRMRRVDKKNNSGKTSIDIARTNNHDLVITVLRRHL